MKTRFANQNNYWIQCKKYLRLSPSLSIFFLIIVAILYEWGFIGMPGKMPMLTFTGLVVGGTILAMIPLGDKSYKNDFLFLGIFWLTLAILAEFFAIYTTFDDIERSFIVGIIFVLNGLLNLLNAQGALKTGLR